MITIATVAEEDWMSIVNNAPNAAPRIGVCPIERIACMKGG